MAKRDLYGSTTGWSNGPDPDPRKSNCYADSDPISPDAYDYSSQAGDGGREGLHHSDQDDLSGDARFRQNNIIASTDPDYAGNAQHNVVVVDNSRADRGRES